jgi:bis(5'-nucleosyl)-tetraphosphatase (symmetrical)
MARYAIGDIQGCMSSLERLLTLIGFDRRADELWLVGDLVNRGPRSLDVLRWARDLGDRAPVVLGNHDLHLLARAAGVAKAKKRDTLDEVLAAPDRDELIGWLRHRPLVHVADGFLMVHAGVHMAWSLAEVEGFAREFAAAARPGWATWWRRRSAALSWSRTAAATARAGDPRLPGGCDVRPTATRCTTSTARRPSAARRAAVVRAGAAGAARARRGVRPLPPTARVTDRIIATDSACVWGGALTAVRLDDRAVFAVPAVEPSAG